MRFSLLALLLFACLTHSVSFNHKDDATAVARVSKNWSGSGMTLSLCEDVATAAMTPESGCQIDHVARGSNLGVEREDAPSGGCGGCPEGNAVMVVGKLNGKDVKGQVNLGSLYDEAPYALPYFVELTCTDPMNPCTFEAELDDGGKLTMFMNGGASSVVLDVTGDATCQ